MSIISIDDHQLPFDTHNEYSVHVGGDTIHTLLTFCPHKVTEWISKVSSSPSPLLIGLDIEWRPNRSRHQDNPAATLQLCVAGHCLIFQLLYCPPDQLPPTLFAFLANKDSVFCGVGIQNDVDKLVEDYGLYVGGRVVDLGSLASVRRDDKALKKAGLKELARVVLGKEVQKPKSVSCSRWDQEWLYPEQVKYACVDAYLSFEIGRVLNAASA